MDRGEDQDEMAYLREVLVSEVTGLKSLLRLTADGIGDSDDLVAQLTRTRIALEKFSSELLGSGGGLVGDEDEVAVLTPPMSTCTSTSSSPSRFSLQSTRSSHSSFSSSSHHRRHFHSINKTYQDNEEEKYGDGDEFGDGEVGQDDAFLRLSSILAGLQAQAEAAVSSGFISTSAPTTPLVRGFVDGQDATTTEGDGTTPGPPKCALQRTLSLPHPYLAPAPRRLRKVMTTMTSIKPVEDEDCLLVTPPAPPMFVSTPEDNGMPPTPPSPRKRGEEEGLMARPALSETPSDTPVPSPLLEKNSYLPKELEAIDGLVAEFLEGTEKMEVMFKWVWIYLLGGGIVWAVVGWVLGWGCTECRQCPVF